MKIAPMNQELERPSLEELKEFSELKKQEATTAIGNLILEDSVLYDYWAKKIGGLKNGSKFSI